MDYIKTFDFLSINPKLFVDQNVRFKNSLGGLMTIFVFLFIFIISSISMIGLIKGNNMRVIINEEMVHNPKYNLTNVPILFQILNEMGENLNNTHRLFKVQANKVNINNHFRNNNKPNIIYPTSVNIKSCYDTFLSNNERKSEFSDLLDESLANRNDCIDLSDETMIEGKINEDRNQKFITINLKRCVNSTLNNFTCLSTNEIDKALNKTQFVLRMADFYLDNNNYAVPGQPYLKKDITTLNPQSLKLINYFIERIEYNSDNGLFFTENKNLVYFKQERAKNENYLVYEEDGFSILKIIISMSKKKTSYIRTYDKFHNYLASVMAVSQLLILISKFILSLFIDDNYFNYICNYVNLFQKFEIDLLNRNIIKNKTRRNNVHIEGKSANLLNENSMNKVDLLNKDNFVFLKNKPLEKKNESNKNIKINKLRIRGNKLSDVITGNNHKNNKTRVRRPSMIKNIDGSSNTNLNNVENIINIHINKEKNVLNNIIIKEEKSFEIQNKIKTEHYKSSNNNINLNNISNANLQNVNMTNLALLSKNFNSGSRIFKKPSTRLKINYFDLFKKYFFNCKVNRLKALDLGVDYIKKKLSIEELLRKILEVDKLKFLTIDKDILDNFSNIVGPDVFFLNEEKNCDLDNHIYNRNLIFENDYTEEMWNRFEFKENFRKNPNTVKNLFKLSKKLIIE